MQFLKDRQVAARLGISRPTLWRWVKDGRLPRPVKLGPAVTRWRLSDIEKFEASLGGASI